jgi:hypothetical protein
VGFNQEGTITNCYATGSVSGTEYSVGGLVGFNREGTIINCYSEADVSGTSRVGGLVGSNFHGTITNSYSTSSISGVRAGGLVGWNWHGIITNCYSTGSISGSWAGGLVGWNAYGTITNCYSEASVSGYDLVGGLVGRNERGTITNCYSTGSVSGTGWEEVGGLVGRNEHGTIANCYATGSVSGDEEVGGLVGENEFGTITNCYATGSVTGTTAVGGLVGYNERGLTFGSFWDTQTSGQSASDGGMGKTTAEMQTAITFTGWGCCSIWTIQEGNDYPRLWWENMSGEPITNPSYWQGSGESNDPYLIDTAEQLNTIGLIPCDWDKHFLLCADIDLSGFTGKDFNIIGNFTGVFDGNGHTISNFNYISTGTNYIGLFKWVDDPNAEIKNLGLIDPNLDAGTGGYVGSLVGFLRNGTITNCYVEAGSVSGYYYVGGLVGTNSSHGTITNCHLTASVSGDYHVGGLVGFNYGTITNCYLTGSVSGNEYVGGLVGRNEHGTITNCYSTASVTGNEQVGGLVGENHGTITNCYSTGDVSGTTAVGGLVGLNDWGTITNCYSTGSILGNNGIGGLVGVNGKHSRITNCYATGSVMGTTAVGGLVGYNRDKINNCYSMCSVSGVENVGGLVGDSGDWSHCSDSFWDTETSGQTTSAGGTPKTTAEMQMASTFTDAGWDFFGETTNGTDDIWFVDEGVDYPRLWWETVPVLHPEPEVTLGTNNIISWGPLPGANEYYAECAADANFTNILYNTGWIAETSYEFTGLELGQQYWYSVKARNSAGTETGWSNVESSLQCTLSEAVDAMLEPNTLKNKNVKNALLDKINAVQQMITDGLCADALNKLENDILQKTDGCAEQGEPDKNDWIINCEQQNQIYPLVIETIEYVRSLM